MICHHTHDHPSSVQSPPLERNAGHNPYLHPPCEHTEKEVECEILKPPFRTFVSKRAQHTQHARNVRKVDTLRINPSARLCSLGSTTNLSHKPHFPQQKTNPQDASQTKSMKHSTAQFLHHDTSHTHPHPHPSTIRINQHRPLSFFPLPPVLLHSTPTWENLECPGLAKTLVFFLLGTPRWK